MFPSRLLPLCRLIFFDFKILKEDTRQKEQMQFPPRVMDSLCRFEILIPFYWFFYKI